MVRISHAASYFMPLFCYSKPSVVVLACAVTAMVFAAAYMSSFLLSKQHADPELFKPNAQDYFRTSLLGVFSPILYYFIKTFLFNANRQFVILNFLIDFALNDWFILFILVCLAYPQQEQRAKGEYTNVWHIIPRQSYVFGIAWSLGEFIICATANLFSYQEVAGVGGTFASKGDVEDMVYEVNHDAEPQDSLRKNITLSKCVGVRRNSSTISQNVYCSEYDLNYYYGSTRNTARKNADERPADDTVMVVDPAVNSLRLTFSRADDGFNKDGSNIRDPRRMETSSSEHTAARKFLPFQNNRELFQALLLLGLVLTSNILSIIGESMIFSIFFIYVPQHDPAFSRVVNYFGGRSFQFFLLTVLLPFILLNLFVNVAIFYWNDVDESHSHSPETPPSTAHLLTRDYTDFYDSDISLQRSRPGSMGFPESNIALDPGADPTPFILMTSPTELHYYNNGSTGNYDTGSRVLAITKNIINAWKSVARKDSFVLSAMFTWGFLLFTVGLFSTVF
ncbi:hypothetical protein HG536_0C05400 [Torulaspora globosa]|uniref:Uncharacterized protein n=1 Tax=Torulaspora globosa TaxID=48254 RepID=A0A7G3ZFT5_9SACH|nr:uncharacterized protein HG536_0C05400 [Torulaspora globosa]QLL32371.1 hypothetical protein HG536_0C05400 [Torulaspora globosa]